MKRGTDAPLPSPKQAEQITPEAIRRDRTRRIDQVLTKNYRDFALRRVAPDQFVHIGCVDQRTGRTLAMQLYFMPATSRETHSWISALRFFHYLARAEQARQVPVTVRISELWWEHISALQFFARISIPPAILAHQAQFERTRTMMFGRIEEDGLVTLNDALRPFDQRARARNPPLAFWLRMLSMSLLWLHEYAGALLAPQSSHMIQFRPMSPTLPGNAHVGYHVGDASEQHTWLVPVAAAHALQPVLVPRRLFTKRGGVIAGIPDVSTMHGEPLRAE